MNNVVRTNIVPPHTYTALDMWQYYVKKYIKANPECWAGHNHRWKTSNYFIYKKGRKGEIVEVMSYKRFRAILCKLNITAGDMIIEGKVINLTNDLGILQGRVIERDPNYPKVDFHATKLYKEQNPDFKGAIYYTDDHYCRIAWTKGRTIANGLFYQFKPSGSPLTKKFSAANKADLLLKNKYQFIPLKR